MDIFRQGNFNEDKVKFTVTFFIVLISISFMLFFVRLFYLQVIIGQELKEKSENNRLRNVTLDSYRGKIIDRNGKVIANNKSAFNLMVILEDTEDLKKEFTILSSLLDVDYNDLRKRIKGKPRYLPILLKRNLLRKEVARFEEHKIDMPGVYISFETLRNYPHLDSLSHLVGYIGEVNPKELNSNAFKDRTKGDQIGKSGVERVYEKSLFGSKGEKIIEVDSAGRELSIMKLMPSKSGKTLKLSIDMDLQKIAENAMKGKQGAVVAMNPKNGEILTFLSMPNYNPNKFSGGISSKEWNTLLNMKSHPLNNRVIQGLYPPGSVYKIVVGAAILEEKILDPNQKVYCNGKFTLGRRTYRCWKKTGHGYVDFQTALKRSCDVYFYKNGYSLGIDKIAEYANLFGFGRKSGINFPHEESGLIPTQKWKKRVKKEPWIGGETISASIGQGFNLVTPLQVAVATSVIANGGYRVTPKIVLNEPTKKARIKLKKGNLNLIVEAMRQVVMEPGGTGGRARVEGIQVAGKTGTAQVVGMKENEEQKDLEEIIYTHRDHAWFTSFAPVNDPEIVVSVIVEHGGHGGSTAAPVAQEIIEAFINKRKKASGE
ncbi:MAG: penicillin-binding protein 2 [Nitrospinae bacterium]|nr:penicillin-binding protein 2 [Nitrospinota bacterium]